jgi:hypothetical protein
MKFIVQELRLIKIRIFVGSNPPVQVISRISVYIILDQPFLLSEKTFLLSEFFSRQKFFWYFGKGKPF